MQFTPRSLFASATAAALAAQAPSPNHNPSPSLPQAPPPIIPLLWTQGQLEPTIRAAVREVAGLFVNGQRLGPRLHPPYTWDITAAVKPGRNELWLDVTNTAFAKWPDSFSHGGAASGLFGPVKILRETP